MTATDPNPEPPITATSHPTAEVYPTPEVLPGSTLVGARSGLCQVTGEVAWSSAMPGMVAVDTEHGTLYLDADLPVRIVNPNAPPLLTAPLSAPALHQHTTDADGTIRVRVPVDFDQLVDGDIEALNDTVTDAVLDSGYGLHDLRYKAVAVLDDGSIVIEVTADASEFFSEHLCQDYNECGGVLDEDSADGWCAACLAAGKDHPRHS